jgi:hypothetical protein
MGFEIQLKTFSDIYKEAFATHLFGSSTNERLNLLKVQSNSQN